MKQLLCVIAAFMTITIYGNGSDTESTENLARRHVQVAQYNPNAIYRINGMQGYTTAVQFGEQESVLSVNIGDSSSWLLNVQGDVINLKPTTDEPNTNMNVLTTRGTYQFILTAPKLEVDEAGELLSEPHYDTMFLLKFEYPEDERDEALRSTAFQNAPKNWHYTARGNSSVAPLAVYDNGLFTYFDFGQRKQIPAIFMVDSRGQESMVNYHVEGKYVVVEGVTHQFTLRNGDLVANVFNETR